MNDPFGVYEVNKGLIARWQAKRDLKRRTEFSQRKGGDGKMIPTKELYGIRWKDNPTDKAKVKEMKSDLKAHGQKRAVRVNIDRKNPQLTVLTDGHHRVAAQRKLRNKYTKANIGVRPTRNSTPSDPFDLVAKKYMPVGPGDTDAPRHKQVLINTKHGPAHVDRKMKRTIQAMDKKGYDTRYSDQGDFSLKRKPETDAYVTFADKGNKKLKNLPPKRFSRERDRGNFAYGDRPKGPRTTIRFRSGPGFGVVNRASLRREVAKRVLNPPKGK